MSFNAAGVGENLGTLKGVHECEPSVVATLGKNKRTSFNAAGVG
jgi:hypothetical protein